MEECASAMKALAADLTRTDATPFQRLVDASEACSRVLHLLGKAEQMADAGPLETLRTSLVEARRAATDQDSIIREDESWGNSGALLQALEARLGVRPTEGPSFESVTGAMAEVLGSSRPGPEQLEALRGIAEVTDYNVFCDVVSRDSVADSETFKTLTRLSLGLRELLDTNPDGYLENAVAPHLASLLDGADNAYADVLSGAEKKKLKAFMRKFL